MATNLPSLFGDVVHRVYKAQEEMNQLCVVSVEVLDIFICRSRSCRRSRCQLSMGEPFMAQTVQSWEARKATSQMMKETGIFANCLRRLTTT
jgi:hypothetical protein